MTLRAPFPWFGGKSRAAHLVWPRFGDVSNYIEPFAGSLATLLYRPHDPRVETVNDIDAYLANFWRAVQAVPDEVARHADWPVNEADLHARHRWLVETAADRIARVKRDPEYFDAQVAGWWVWGQCLWIGSGWCARPEWTGRVNAGRAVHRRWNSGGAGAGQGVCAQNLTKQQVPDLSGSRGATGRGIHATAFELKSDGLYAYMHALQARLRRVRVCCGDWRRVLTPAVTTYIGLTAVFLDPPYSQVERSICYSNDNDVAVEVRTWALEHGDDPTFRIALCGYEGEHAMPDTWECVPWRAGGGYGRSARGKKNRHRERIWFSPHCLKDTPPLFAEPRERVEAVS